MGFKQFLKEGNENVTVFFDMDSVLADFIKKALEYNPQWSEDALEDQTINDDDFWPNIIKISKFWETLEPIKEGFKLLHYCIDKGYDCQILSSPSRHDTRSTPGKQIWIKKHIKSGITKVNLVRASHKQKYATPNSVLIDDLKKNIDQFKAKGGQVVHFHKDDKSAFKKLLKALDNAQGNLKESVSPNEFDNMLDQIGKGIDIKPSKHFFDRINDRDISLSMVIDTLEKFMKRHQNNISRSARGKLTGLIKDVMTNLNIPIEYDTNGTPEPDDDIMSLITVMRKRNFVPSNRKDIVYSVRR